mmetsp:Transcript_51082/g.125470  ORF Transcript_51082/g.125470 Transcript_51082/m.125470 type:complete len:196 (-) Transcript_51082:609-1196(-)
MRTGRVTQAIQSSLGAFFPGLQVLYGRVKDAVISLRVYYNVWRKYGSLPEGYSIRDADVAFNQVNNPLRPELVESTFYMHWATQDPSWVGMARNMLWTFEVFSPTWARQTRIFLPLATQNISRAPCGFASIKDVRSLQQEDLMERCDAELRRGLTSLLKEAVRPALPCPRLSSTFSFFSTKDTGSAKVPLFSIPK